MATVQHLQHTLIRHTHGHLERGASLDVGQSSGTGALDGRMTRSYGLRFHAQIQAHLVEGRRINDSTARRQNARTEEALAYLQDFRTCGQRPSQLRLLATLQTPGVGELLCLSRYQAIGHGVLVVGLIIQRAQQSGRLGKVPAAHLEPAQIELHIAVQAELCVRDDGQNVQLTVDVNGAQLKRQYGLGIAIDANVLWAKETGLSS